MNLAFHTAGKVAWVLALATSAIVGLLTIAQWVSQQVPPSIEAAHAAFGNWMTTPMLSPMDLIGLVLVVLIVYVVLMYPMVMPRP